MTSTWEDQQTAIGMRDVIAAIADTRIKTLRPETSYAVVQSINREQRSATVLYMGDTEAVVVAMGSIEPATVGQTVRIGGLIGHRYIEDVLGNAIMSGNDGRYAQVGHTHAGGGAVELDLDDLGDVDLATNPPGPDTVLGYNDVGGYWEPVSIDLGTDFLPLTGGTVSGSTTFSAPLTASSTLNVGGALTAQSVSGVGTNLTFLNASALASGTVPVARMPNTIGSNTTGTAAAWTTGRLLNIEGDMVGSATIKGDADVTMSVSLQPNSIALGADTTGNYVQHIIGTANQIISNTVVATEGSVHTLSLPQSIHPAATPSFARVLLSQATGTAPLSVLSQTMVSNLNVELLAGETGAFYRNAGNLNAGNVPSARLTGEYTGITRVGTLSTLTVSGVAALGFGSTVAGNTVWHAGNDGPGSGLDAGLLGGVLPAGYANIEIVESLMGDLLAVGLYDAASYNNDLFSLIFDRPVQTHISGLTIAGGDHPFSVSFDLDLPEIPQQDVLSNVARRRIFASDNAWLDIARYGDDDHLQVPAAVATTPGNVNLTPGGDFTIRARLRKTDLDSSAVTVIAHHGSTGTNESWMIYMEAGQLNFRFSPNGVAHHYAQVLSAPQVDAITNTSDNSDFYISLVVHFTGTTIEMRGWGSPDGFSWTPAAPAVSQPFAQPFLFATTAPIIIGGASSSFQLWDGRIYWVDVLSDVDPNGSGSPVWRFDSRDHISGLTFTDPDAHIWTLTAAAISHPNYQVEAFTRTTPGLALRALGSGLFLYSINKGRPFHIRLTWDSATDTLRAGYRAVQGSIDLTAASPAWTELSATHSGDVVGTIGPIRIGNRTDAGENWAFNGRMRRALIVKNGATLLDLRHTNLSQVGQMTVTPSVGPVMSFSHSTIATTTMPKPTWAEGPNVYRHNMYWIVSSSGEVDFIDSDLSGRYEVDIDDAVTVSNGDWVVAVDPLFGAVGHEEGANLSLGQMVFQYIPFSTETYVKAQIQQHLSDPLDPHSAAGYLKAVTANSLYAPVVHTHAAEISGYIALHTQESDPHVQYLTITRGDGRYLKPGDIQPYEPQGAVLQHEQKPDPHPQYVSHAEANAGYAAIDHAHIEYAYTGHTHADSKEVLPTDGAQSSKIFIGDDEPVNPQVGDLWIQTFDISLQAPAAPTGLTLSTPAPTSLGISWNAWDLTVGVTAVQVERSLNGLSGWTNVLNDATAPFATSYTDTGRAERTSYWYRVRSVNLAGNGTWGTLSASTTNGPPAAPSGLSASNVSPSNVRLNWSAVSSPSNDPLHATQPYEVFKNGTSQGFTTGLYWDFGSLSENTTISMGVRSKDDLGLTSAVASINGATSNADPPAPTGVNIYYTGPTELHFGWNAVGGISDFYTYQVFLNGNYVANTTSTAYGMGGLSPSTSYTLGVRTVDTSIAVSSISSVSGSTSVNPDTTPPGPISFHSWQPRNNYGEMYFEFTAPGEIAYGEIFYNVNGAGWVRTYQGGLGGYHMHYNGNHGADQTIYAAVNYRDAAGNWYYSPHYAYTLVPSPMTFSPHSSNSWRGTNGGEWNANGGYKVVQGWFSNPALNSFGFWFYGTDFSDRWQNGRTITGAEVFINREGCGINQQDWVSLGLHNLTSSPGTTSFWGTPAYGGGVGIGTVQYGESKWMGFDVSWAYELVTGVRRGLCIFDINTGKPYLCLHPAGTGFSGTVNIHHLG